MQGLQEHVEHRRLLHLHAVRVGVTGVHSSSLDMVLGAFQMLQQNKMHMTLGLGRG